MPDTLLATLDRAHAAVVEALEALPDWTVRGQRDDQYACDIAADAAVFAVLDAAGYGVVSEERPPHGLDRDVVVVVDPVDGTANAVRGIPYYAVSLCAVDGDGMLAALVVNLATGTRFEAVRGEGARCDGAAISPSGCTTLDQATVALSGLPRPGRPWRHMRAFGATALELCDVARGVLDAVIDTDDDRTAPWDYLGGLLVCQEAGAVVADATDRPLLTLEHTDRRQPQAAATPALLAAVRRYITGG